MMEDSMISLPPELWSQICQSLAFKNVCAMRLSCRAMNIGTYHYFADKTFHDFYLTLTSEGLRALEYVARHEIFSQHVKRLWIVPSLFLADYTWTLDEMKRPIEVQDDLQKRRRHFQPLTRNLARLLGKSKVTAVESPAPSLSNEPCLTSLSELAIEDRYLIYKDAVIDHFRVLLSSPGETSTERTRLQDTLENCLPLLSNLHTTGLRNYTGHPDYDAKRFPKVMRGTRSLQRQLGFNPVHPMNRQDALGTTHTRITALETCGGMMVDDGISLTPSEEEALIPIFQQLQELSVQISSAHTQESERQSLCEAEEQVAFLVRESAIWEERKNSLEIKKNRLLPLLAKAAPGIQTLDLTMHPASTRILSFCQKQDEDGLDLADAHFDWIAEHFKFSRLSVLSLKNIVTTVSSFKEFLKTALSTLTHVTLDYLIWTSDLKIPRSERRRFKEEGVRICQELLAYLRNHSRIQSLSMDFIGIFPLS
ncbi:unnamed protein product [Penicillium camemberti]|uniref:Str. FM013 n=1 Tax=Penicillium camemberti (strain FM 013) TaxID=1429867 RepID=A0A0G4PNI1_PENC3|nr:unnamed protein product [Penicillium camemberti]